MRRSAALISSVGVLPISYFVFDRRRQPSRLAAAGAEGQIAG
jgi:hypothetical protein